MVVSRLHGDTVERTNIDAEFAGRASDRVHFGLGDGQGLDLFDRLTTGVHDGLDRAMDAANAAVNAELGIDVEDGFFLAGNGLGRALDRAKGTSDAVVENNVRHDGSFKERDLLKRWLFYSKALKNEKALLGGRAFCQKGFLR